MSEKCLVYDDSLDIDIVWMMEKFSAQCMDVADVKLDLATLPAQIDSLYMQAARRLVLHPGAFDRFSDLEQLHIEKCPDVIHSGAFSGLPNLRMISFNRYTPVITECCSTVVFPNAFGQLPNLTEISFDAYNISAMSTDFSVFTGLKNLKVLRFRSCGTKILDIACRIAELSHSLTSLNLEADGKVILRCQSCPRLEDASTSEHFKPLESIKCEFPGLKFLEEGVFKHFPKISFLNMPLNRDLKMQLMQSGVRKIATFDAELEEGGFGLVCDLVLNLSVESLHLKLKTNFTLHDDIELEGCVGLRELKLSSSFMLGELRFFRVLKNLQVLEINGIFLPQSFSNLCATPDSAAPLQRLILNKQNNCTTVLLSKKSQHS